MKKKILAVLIFALACTGLAVGCRNKGGSSPDDSENLKIVDSALTLDCFETYTLAVESQSSGSIDWISSDPSVVSVDENGSLTAGMKLGTATITARRGKYSDDCNVTVLLKSGLPKMESVKSASVSEGGKYEIPFHVYYNAIDVSQYLSFGCNAEDETAESVATASVSGNVVTFHGIAEGETAFTVYTTVFDRLYAEKVKINVRNTDVVYVVNGAVDNQLQLRRGIERFTSDVEVYYKNEKVPDDTLEWSVSDGDVAAIGEGGKLIANMEGTAVLSTEYRGKKISVEVRTIKDRESVTVEQTAPADVNLDVAITADETNQKRTYAVNETKTETLQIGKNTDQGVVVRAYLEGKPFDAEGLSFSDGAVTIPTKAFGTDLYGEKTMTIEVEDQDVVRIYTFKVLLITKIPRTLVDFRSAVSVRWRGDRIFGYFVLDADMDFNSYEISIYATDWNWDNGFRGTLDGRGHSLRNVRTAVYGISAQMGEGAVLKNLKIPNLKHDGVNGTYGTALFARGACGVTFENIEITLTADSACTFNGNTNECGVLVSHDMRRCTFKDVTIHAEGKALQKIFGGKGDAKGSSVYENVKIYAASVAYYENDMTAAPDGVTLITN